MMYFFSIFVKHQTFKFMIYRLSIFFVLACLCNTLFAIDASVKYATFKGIEQENYIEIYFHVKGKSVTFGRVDNDKEEFYQAVIDLNINVLQNNKIVNAESYTIQSPIIKTATPSGIALIDMLRLSMPNGEYTLDVSMTDRYQTGNTILLQAPVIMNYEGDEIAISDVQLLGDFEATEEEGQYVKHGYILRPFTFDVYPSFVKKLIFYTEIYNTDTHLEGKYLTRYYVQAAGAKGEPITGLMGFKKHTVAPVNVVMAQMDISTLPEGEYELVIEVRNAQNELLKSKALKLRRSYPFPDSDITDYEKIDITGTFVEALDKDRLNTSVRALSPLLVGDEMYTLNKVMRKKDDLQKRQLLCYYWTKINEIDPEEPYDEYMKRVDVVNKLFTNAMGKGYQTDRGQIYLRYGTPSDVISQQSEPSAPPYEVWFYARTLDNQSDVKFVFYNPSLANGDFELLHSTARGERHDPQWKKKLYSNIPGLGQDALDGTGAPGHYGSQVDRIYREW